MPRSSLAAEVAPAPDLATESADALFRLRLRWIVLGALVWRVVYVLGAKLSDELRLESGAGDQYYYSLAAEALAHGRGFVSPVITDATVPAADHPPLTALVATPASFLPGWSVVPQRLTMCVVGAAAVWVIALVAREIAGVVAGLAAAVIAALYPGFWVNDGLIMSESLGALTLAATLLALYRWRRDPTRRWAIFIGLACGFAVLTRAEAALLAPITIAPAMLLWRGPAWRERLVHIGVAAAGAVVVVAPWVGANLIRFEKPVFLSTNDGLTLLGANCDGVYSGGGIGLWRLQCALELDTTGMDQSEQSAFYREKAFDYVDEHRDRLPAVVAARVGRVWSLYEPEQMIWYNEGEGREPWGSRLALWGYVAVLAPAAIGIVLLRSRGVPVWPLVSQFVNVTVVAALFYGLLRFRIAAEVSLVILAAVTVAALLETRQTAVQP